MENRELDQEEISRIQKAIAVKELTSAEILMEVYDHYVSHLESKSAAKFEDELFELEQKFTHSYCHALQAKFLKASKKDIHQTQWSIIKSYFTWPRFLGTLIALVALVLLWNDLEGKARGLAVAIPMAIITVAFSWIFIKSWMKVRKIKQATGQKSIVQSSYITNLTTQFIPVIGLFNIFIHIPKFLGFEGDGFTESSYFVLMSFLLCVLYIGYALSLLEAWKIKSKTALI